MLASTMEVLYVATVTLNHATYMGRRTVASEKPRNPRTVNAGYEIKAKSTLATMRREALELPHLNTLRRCESVLLWAVRLCIVLLLLVPCVVTTSTVFPFVVGKALYCRVLIELAVGLWALLLLANPSFGPPRSTLLVLLALGLGSAAVSAWFGVSWQRSVWSNYERMQGVVETVHWFACTVVVVSTFRNGESLRALLNLNLAASLAVALLAIASFVQLDLPVYGVLFEKDYPRIGASLGNSTYLGTYALVNSIVASGLLTRSFAKSEGNSTTRTATLAARFFWTLAAVLNVTALLLSGSMGSLVGLAAAVLLVVALCVSLMRSLVVRLAVVAAAVGLGVVVVYGIVMVQSGTVADWSTNPMLQRLAGANAQDRSVQQRLFAMRAGVDALAERPLTGWGPENFVVVFGRHVEDLSMEVHDNSHNKLIEEVATKGVLGLAGFVALWGFGFYVLLRAALRHKSGERIFALTMAAALAGYFVNAMTLFDTAVLNLLGVLLLACCVYWEVETRVPQVENGRPRAKRRLAVHIALAVFAISLVAVGLTVNRTIHAAAVAIVAGVQAGYTTSLEYSIAEFEPLANLPRRLYFERLAENWRSLRVRDGVEARRRLRLADQYADAAVASEPDNWRLREALARMYGKVAATEPAYRAKALRHEVRLTQLVPAYAATHPEAGRQLD